MKTQITFIGLLMAVAFGQTACEKVIDLDVPEGEVQLVVDGWLTDHEDTVQYLILTTTAPYFEDKPTPRVSSANVTIHTYEGETLIESTGMPEDPNKPGHYPFPFPAEIGKGYQVEIDAPPFPPAISDIQQVLEVPPILDIFWEEASPDFQDSLAIYRVFISTFEFPGPGDFYRWFIFVDGEFQNAPFNIYVQNDLLVDGMNLPKFSVTSTRYRFGQRVRIVQSRINENAYDFLSLLRFQTAFIGSPFDTPPAPLVGNVRFMDSDRTALGFFSVSATSEAEVVVGVD
ncbi:MAG: DUF4249 domain-containing protein [Cryomorphaceae bacterium]|nr:MAG: DUF4249 domain-containing protein [Cryomorphaceae bacterium]